MKTRTIVLGAIATLVAAFGAACLSTSGLDDGTKPACNADLQTDIANCGTCGNACPNVANTTQTCVAGKCTAACNAGSLDCNANPADGCEATIASDTKNCGACGHDCLGGACNGSVCQPITIQSVTGRATGVAVDDSGVYFGLNPPGGTTSEVVRVAKDGSGAQPLVSNRSNVSALAIDDTFVYWIEVNAGATGRVLKVQKDGSSSVPQTVATGLAVNADAQLVVDAPNAIWSAYGVDDGTDSGVLLGGGVYSCALAGCGASPSAIGSFPAVSGVAVSNPSVFFGLDGGTFDCPVGGCAAAPAQVPGSTESAVQLTSDTQAVTWTTPSEVARLTVASSTLSVVATGLAGLHAVTNDAQNVYFTSISAGTVYACPVTGCTGAPTTMATGLTAPAYIAQDATAVYVTSGSAAAGTVSRIAK